MHPAVLKNRPQQSEVAAAVKYKSRVLVAYDADNDQDLQGIAWLYVSGLTLNIFSCMYLADLIVDRAVQRLEAHLTKIMTDAQNRFAVSVRLSSPSLIVVSKAVSLTQFIVGRSQT